MAVGEEVVVGQRSVVVVVAVDLLVGVVAVAVGVSNIKSSRPPSKRHASTARPRRRTGSLNEALLRHGKRASHMQPTHCALLKCSAQSRQSVEAAAGFAAARFPRSLSNQRVQVGGRRCRPTNIAVRLGEAAIGLRQHLEEVVVQGTIAF